MNKEVLSKAIGLSKTIINQEINDLKYKLIVINSIKSNDISNLEKTKDIISPNCKTCLAQCGRTSNFDFNSLDEDLDIIKEKKLLLLDLVIEICKYDINNYDLLIDAIIKSLFFINEYIDEATINKYISSLIMLSLNYFNDNNIDINVSVNNILFTKSKDFITYILNNDINIYTNNILFDEIISYVK